MRRSGRGGCSRRPCTRAATGPATTSRASSPAPTTRPSAWSSWAAGVPWSSATCLSGAGSTASAAARTSAGSASPARCRDSPTSSCRSWTSRPARGCRPPPAACTARSSAPCGPSPPRRRTRSRSGARRAPNCSPATRKRGDSAMTTTAGGKNELTEMAWDPITRIVGSLGIVTKNDFKAKRGAEGHRPPSIFRGYSIFMKGKDPRDAHFIPSRICGICGDNHATCATYAQNMAFGIRPPAIAEWIVNLGEAAEYMFDHNIFQDNLVGVDFCETMVKETNPAVWEKAQRTPAPHAADHGYKTIGDIMKALNPFEGEFYRETLHVSRYTREMFCLMEGRHVHPATLYPGGVGPFPTIHLLADYLVRLMKYLEFLKKVVPLHDDLFDFFYEALPGYEKVGQRRILLA